MEIAIYQKRSIVNEIKQIVKTEQCGECRIKNAAIVNMVEKIDSLCVVRGEGTLDCERPTKAI